MLLNKPATNSPVHSPLPPAKKKKEKVMLCVLRKAKFPQTLSSLLRQDRDSWQLADK